MAYPCKFYKDGKEISLNEVKKYIFDNYDKINKELGGQKNVPPITPIEPKEKNISGDEFRDKSIKNRLLESENIPKSFREKISDNLKYKVQSHEEAKSIAKGIIKEYGVDNAVLLAEANKFDDHVNSFIFSESLNDVFNEEQLAKTPEEKTQAATKWADISMKFDEIARGKGRFIAAIGDFYKTSPIGAIIKEKAVRENQFADWFKNKEKNYKEVFEAIKDEPEFKELISGKVKEELKKERAEARKARIDKFDAFIDKAKFNKDALYAVPIPTEVINSALEIIKKGYKAGEKAKELVENAIDYISEKIGKQDWDKERFRKEWNDKLAKYDNYKEKKTSEELSIEKQEKLLERFRKKLKGLNEEQKEQVIKKSFKKLVENGALEYNDFKEIISETLGLGKLSEEETKKITELVNQINKVGDLGTKARETREIKDLQDYLQAKKDAEKAATELGNIVYNKPNLPNRLLSIMQLNTLGIPSLVNNPIFNIFNQAFVRFPIGVQLTALDYVLNKGAKVFGTEILPENNIVAGQKEFWTQLGKGSKESVEQTFNGLTNKDYFQKEVHTTQIHPYTSAKDLWLNLKGEKYLTTKQKIDKLLQSTVGVPAEIVARLLNVGDKPQRYAAEGSQAAAFGKMLNLKGKDLEFFINFPKEEAFKHFKQQGLSDEKAMEQAQYIVDRIIGQGEESTFQQDNLLNDIINAAFKPLGLTGEVVKKFNMPFMKIPLNAAWSFYNLMIPELAFTQSFVYGVKFAKTGNKMDLQMAKKWMAHGTTGLALMAIAGSLANKGIINSDNDEKTTKKERESEKYYEQQKSINLTKLSALISGKNPNDVKQSLNIDLKWLGVIGNILNVQADKLEEMTPEQKKNKMSYMEDLLANLHYGTTDFIENGVFSNSSGLLNAMTKGGEFANMYALNLLNMATNVFQPAAAAQMSRASLPYYTKAKADNFYEEVKNNFLNRSSWLRKLSGQYPPAKVSIWGDRFDKKDNTLMRLFGISTSNKDNFAQPIYEDYKRTNNTKFFPPSVKPEINDHKLNAKQAEQLETLVGQARKNMIAPFINDGATLSGYNKKYSELNDTEKVDALNIIYDMGFKLGKEQFVELYPDLDAAYKTTEQKKESIKNRKFRNYLKKNN